jgi:hypothetical protein
VLFVAYENETVLGSIHQRTREGYHADGAGIPIDDSLEGNHTIRVVVYTDTNLNARFDPTIDELCRDDGQAIQAGPRTVNVSAGK